MVSANQLREMVSEYLRGVVDLEAFSKNFGMLFDDIECSGDAGAVKLSYQIESFLADCSAGFVSEPVLRESLTKCLVQVDIEMDPAYINPAYLGYKDQNVSKSEATASALPSGDFSFA